jgi:hypothetical protein
MKFEEFDQLISKWKANLAELEVPFRMWYNDLREQSIQRDDPEWRRKIVPSPLDRDKEFRKRFRTLIREMALVYLEGHVDYCERIRKLLSDSPTVVRHLCLPGSKPLQSPADVERFRQYLAIISMQDQTVDMRDQIVELTDLLEEAKKAKIDPSPYLEEIAALSSDADTQGMGSMQSLFRDFRRKRERKSKGSG